MLERAKLFIPGVISAHRGKRRRLGRSFWVKSRDWMSLVSILTCFDVGADDVVLHSDEWCYVSC